MFSLTLPMRRAAGLVLATSIAAGATATASAATVPGFINASFFAIGFVEDDGAAEHMVYAAKLRILSQRIPAAACYEHFGIEKEASAELLLTATAFYDRVLEGLEKGDPELGLMKPETDRAILADIAKVHAVWDPLHGLIEQIAAGNSTDEDILFLAAEGKKLVDLTSHMSSLIMGEYSDPTVLLQADALTLEIAGRMPMMAQRLSKDFCLINGGLDVEASIAEMEETRTLFVNTAQALRHGMPAMGLKATTNETILAALDKIIVDWEAIAPVYDAIAAGESFDLETKAKVFHDMNALTMQLDELEVMYAKGSKMDL